MFSNGTILVKFWDLLYSLQLHRQCFGILLILRSLLQVFGKFNSQHEALPRLSEHFIPWVEVDQTFSHVFIRFVVEGAIECEGLPLRCRVYIPTCKICCAMYLDSCTFIQTSKRTFPTTTFAVDTRNLDHLRFMPSLFEFATVTSYDSSIQNRWR